MSGRNHSGESMQASLSALLELAGNLDGKYSADEIGEVIDKLRAAKRSAESYSTSKPRSMTSLAIALDRCVLPSPVPPMKSSDGPFFGEKFCAKLCAASKLCFMRV